MASPQHLFGIIRSVESDHQFSQPPPPSPFKFTSPLCFTVLKGVLGVGKHGDTGICGFLSTRVHLRDKTKLCCMVAIVYDDRSLDLTPELGQRALHAYNYTRAHTHSTAYTIDHSLLTAAYFFGGLHDCKVLYYHYIFTSPPTTQLPSQLYRCNVFVRQWLLCLLLMNVIYSTMLARLCRVMTKVKVLTPISRVSRRSTSTFAPFSSTLWFVNVSLKFECRAVFF